MHGEHPLCRLVVAQRLGLEVQTCPGHLRITLFGERSTQNASLAAWNAIGDQVVINDATRLLVINRLTGRVPTREEQKQIASSLAARGFERVRVALVLKDSALIPEFEYGVLDSIELGREVAVFGSEEVAVLWLYHGEVNCA